MEFTEQPKQARVHVPNFEQFKGIDQAFDDRSTEGFDEFEKVDYKTEVDKWTPSFDDLPDWVEWVSQDLDGGAWYGFEDKPVPFGSVWVNDDDDTERYIPIKSTPLHPDGWENTLTKRPKKCSERVSVEGKVSVSFQDMDALEAVLQHQYENFSGGIKGFGSESQQATQPHYQTKTGVDFIQRFSDVHSEERVRGALLFSIGKYCERYGDKDDTLKEARKIVDYASRLVKFEESLLEDKDG